MKYKLSQSNHFCFHSFQITEDKNTTNEIILTEGRLFDQLKKSEYASLEEITSDQIVPFLYFLDKYVSKLVGRRELDSYFKSNRDKTLLDRVTPSDIAYAVLLFENGADVWDEYLKIKQTCFTPLEKKNYKRTAQQLYHSQRGTRITLYGEGWTDQGKGYHGEIERGIVKMKKTEKLWNNLYAHWKSYAKEHSKNTYERDMGSGIGAAKDGVGDEDINDDDEFELLLPGDQGYDEYTITEGGNHDQGENITV